MRDLVFDCRLAEAGGFGGEGCLACDSAEDETFEERVAAEAVCAVKACRSDLAAGVEIFDICFRGDVGFNAADHIVCAGADWDEVFADIDIETVAEFAYDGESFGEVLFVEVAYVEIDVGGFGFEHLREDGPADDISRGEFCGGVIILHKRPAFGVAQDCSFAAERFGNQGARCACDIQRRRVKLDKFQILQDRACSIRHSEAVCSCAGRVCGFAVELARAARGENGVERPDDSCVFFLVPADDAEAFVIVG